MALSDSHAMLRKGRKGGQNLHFRTFGSSSAQHSTVYYVTVQYGIVQFVTVQPSPVTLCSIRSFSNVWVRQGSAVLCSAM